MTLLVARILADNANDTLAPDDAAGFTETLDGGADLHRKLDSGILSPGLVKNAWEVGSQSERAGFIAQQRGLASGEEGFLGRIAKVVFRVFREAEICGSEISAGMMS